jgi:hypothetical protein
VGINSTSPDSLRVSFFWSLPLWYKRKAIIRKQQRPRERKAKINMAAKNALSGTPLSLAVTAPAEVEEEEEEGGEEEEEEEEEEAGDDDEGARVAGAGQK